ncbi:MAG: hypothetical protein Q8904_09810 [Bacteroidota bacterium]|nr:hypothetical protein [Bacteroidota bacterium]
MKHLWKLIFTILFALVLICLNTPKGFSQEWNSARLTVLSGSSIPFNFNTLDKIKNGIEITTGTLFGISMADSSKVGHVLQGFVLNFRSFNSQTNIKGDVYTLPLNRLRLKAQSVKGLGSGSWYGYKDLTSDWVPLFSYTTLTWSNLNWANDQLNISYECGKPVTDGGNGSLLGEEPDFYNVEIEFELVPTGPGF